MKYLINLFPEKERNASEQIVFFALHYLRYILVITQFVAICVFFFRFKVDQEIIDLREKLSQKESIVVATSELVERIRETDMKMKQVQLILDTQDGFQKQYGYVLSQMPNTITIEALDVEARIIDIKGSSQSVEPIRAMYETLKAEKRFRVINLSEIEKVEQKFQFTLRLEEFVL